MGWKPTIAGGGPADDDERPSPSPRTRRRRIRAAAAEKAETPLVQAAREASPRESPNIRPRPGVHGGNKGRPQPRIQLGQRWGEIVTAVKAGEYTWQEFTDGLDEEELARGQLRADDGSFVGRPPQFVPREFLLACQREQKRRFEEIFGSEVIGIATEYVKLAKDASIPAKDRAKLMQYAMERIFGGIPKDVRVSQEQPWEQMIVNVVRGGDKDVPTHLSRRYAGYQERLGGAAPGEDEDPDGAGT